MRAIASPRLIGRAAELAVLQAACARAHEDHAVTVLVAGEAGIGKSRLVETGLAEAERDWLVLVGGCLELGSTGAPYAAFTTILRQLVRRLGAELAGLVIGPALMDWLAGSRASGNGQNDARRSGLESTAERSQLLREFVTLVARLIEQRPTVLAIEDLHWADEASLELFVHLARSLPDPGLLLIGTIRTGELAVRHPVRQLLGELRRRVDVVTVDLAPLDRPQVGEQLTALRGRPADPWVAAAIHQRSGGNPLFVESLAEPTEFAANSLHELLVARAARLPGGARSVLTLIAVAGARVPDVVLRDVSGLTDEELSEAVRQLVEHGQVILVEDGYQIRHDLIREAVYTDLLPAERRRLHRRFAQVLAGFSDETLPDRIPELARHWAAAGEPRDALATAWQAARILRGRTAYSAELDQLQTVLWYWPEVPDAAGLVGADRIDVLHAAVTASIAAGRIDRGLKDAGEALTLLDPAKNPAQRADVLCQTARLHNARDGSGQAEIRSALALFPPGRDDERRRRILVWAIAMGGTAQRLEETSAYADELGELARREDDVVGLAWSHLGRILAQFGRGDLERLRPDYLAAVDYAQRAGDDYTLLAARLWWSAALMMADRCAEGVPVALAGYEHAERIGLRRSRGPMLAMCASMGYVALGHWSHAAQLLDEVLAEDVPPLYGAALRSVRAELAVACGDLALAEELIENCRAVAADSPTATGFLLFTELSQLALDLAVGNPEAADEALGRLLADYRPRSSADVFRVALDGMRVQAERQAAAPGNRRIAAAIADRRKSLLAMVDEQDEPVAGHRPYLLSIRALTGTAKLAEWDAAVDAWRANENPLQLADTLTSAAANALSSSNRAGAVVRLREARELADGLGAATLLARIDQLSARAGLGSRGHRQDHVEPARDYQLTQRELQVLRVLAQGYSNRRIAAELFLSPNTVGAHVTRIFTKLGVNSRSEATALALRGGMV